MLADPARTAATTSIVDDGDACLALLRMLADGQRHASVDLARALCLDADSPASATIEAALDVFESAGMPLRRSPGAVQAAPFDVLDEAEVRRALPHWHVTISGSTGSTNADLLRAIRDERATTPRLIASELQVAGRGRRGRRWASAPGVSLTASFALRVGRRLSALDGISLVCGLAVRDAARAFGVEARLKWPNDVLVDGRKLGGILVETHAAGAATIVVVGVGINVATVAREPTAGLAATDLASSGATSRDRRALVAAIAAALERRLSVFADDGFAAFVDEWNAVDAFADAAVVVTAVGDPADARYGLARGVDAGGALLLDGAGGVGRGSSAATSRCDSPRPGREGAAGRHRQLAHQVARSTSRRASRHSMQRPSRRRTPAGWRVAGPPSPTTSRPRSSATSRALRSRRP